MQISPCLEQSWGIVDPSSLAGSLISSFFVDNVILWMARHSSVEQCQGTQAGLFQRQRQHFSGPCPILCSSPPFQHCHTLHWLLHWWKEVEMSGTGLLGKPIAQLQLFSYIYIEKCLMAVRASLRLFTSSVVTFQKHLSSCFWTTVILLDLLLLYFSAPLYLCPRYLIQAFAWQARWISYLLGTMRAFQIADFSCFLAF